MKKKKQDEIEVCFDVNKAFFQVTNKKCHKESKPESYNFHTTHCYEQNRHENYKTNPVNSNNNQKAMALPLSANLI